jgi:hypothetical protein
VTNRRLRLVSIDVHPQFVIDDENCLTPATVPSITVTAGDWGTFAASAFSSENLDILLAQFDAEVGRGRNGDSQVDPSGTEGL